MYVLQGKTVNNPTQLSGPKCLRGSYLVSALRDLGNYQELEELQLLKNLPTRRDIDLPVENTK